MEKIKVALSGCIIAMMIAGNNLSAQDSDLIRPGLISARLTLSPSYSFQEKSAYFYLHGNLEGYLNKNLSVAGEASYYLGKQTSDNSPVDFNHSIFYGMSWHFVKNKNDFYVGLQPGIAVTRLNADHYNLTRTSTGINPLFSIVAGYNLYFYKFFHFFVQTRIVAGEHHHDAQKSLAELRLSAGLGLNINVLKKK